MPTRASRDGVHGKVSNPDSVCVPNPDSACVCVSAAGVGTWEALTLEDLVRSGWKWGSAELGGVGEQKALGGSLRSSGEAGEQHYQVKHCHKQGMGSRAV